MFEPIALVCLIAFAATLFRSTFGFGEAIIAVPLLGLFLPITQAVPLAVLMSILVAVIVLIQDHSKVHFQSAKWLILFAALGIPLRLALLFYANETVIKLILAAVILIYAGYSLFGLNRFRLQTDSKLWLFICGFLSGVFGGAYGVNGPPLVVYGNMRQWDAQYFRATLQAYFLPAGVLSMIGYGTKGLLSCDLFTLFLAAVPAIIPAVFLGRYLNRRISGSRFYRYVYMALVGIGIILILQVVL